MKTKARRWAVRYEPCDGEVFRFSFCSSGTGACWDDRYSQEIRFSWNPAQLGDPAIDDAKALEILGQVADALFWSVINPQLTIRVVTPKEIETLEYAPISFALGSREELERETCKILYGFPDVWLDGVREVWVGFQTQSEHEGIAPRVLCDRFALRLGNRVNEQERSTLIQQLTEAVRQNVPVGEYLCHRMKGGSLYRINSYRWQPKLVWIAVRAPDIDDAMYAGVRSVPAPQSPELPMSLVA